MFLIFLATLFVLILWLLPLLSRQISQLFQQLPAMLTFGHKQLLRLQIRDISGRKLWEKAVMPNHALAGEVAVRLPIKLKAGVYVVSAAQGQAKHLKKLVILP